MSLYAIGDLHLSLASDKPMDVFGGAWSGYVEKLKKGLSPITPDDTLVLCGDLSWALTLEESREDFKFISGIPGRKIILKGNHDYWWSTVSKMKAFFEENHWGNFEFLHNNCVFYQDLALCGTRGWFLEDENIKVFNRELIRLETSLKAAGDREKLCFLHYPPKYKGYECEEIVQLLHKYGVKRCFYGHLHGASHKLAIEGAVDGITYTLVSADFLKFNPFKIE